MYFLTAAKVKVFPLVGCRIRREVSDGKRWSLVCRRWIWSARGCGMGRQRGYKESGIGECKGWAERNSRYRTGSPEWGRFVFRAKVEWTIRLNLILRPVYTCDFWCDFAYKTRLTLPCPNVYFAKRLVDWKERYHILFEDTLLSNFCQLVGILSRRYATINPCGVGWGRFCAQNRIKIASKIACVNGPLDPGLRMTVSKDPEKNSTRKKYSTMVDTSVVTHRTWKRTKRSSWGGPVAEYLAVGWPLPRGVLCPHCVHHHHLYNRQEAQVSIPQQPCLAITTPDIILFLFRFVRVDLNVWLLAVACLMDGL